ncbi:hypothetical protein B0O80DRAFT_192390 [Mortierella sp. GBAus27b]|nr:hypothetical protein B0O80DRAFT_192390 [Mortierella sp. GBAus27b]
MASRAIPGLYSFLKLLCRTLFHIFFRDYNAFHTATIPQNEPVLVVANHGNYLMDALALLAVFPGQISFLMAKPIFDTAIGGIATMIGTIPVERPQDAVKYNGTGQVVISKDARLVKGEGCGRALNPGDTIFVDCGSFQDPSKDSRVTQCYGVVEAVISDHEVLIKAPGLKWIPAALTSERDIQYIKNHKIVADGSFMYRVERGNTLRGIEALKAEELRMHGAVQPSGTSGTLGRVMQKIFSKSPTEAETTSRGGFMALESVTSGADVPGSVPAPADFHSNESTPLLRQSRYFNSPVQHHHPVYSTLKRGDSNTRPISTRSSSMVIDVEDEPNGSAFGHVSIPGRSTAITASGPGSPITADMPSPTALHSPPVSTARFPTEPCPYQYSRPIDHSLIYESVWKNFGERGTVAIFPEGVSSDDYHLLDFKYGCTVMVLGYLAQHSSNTLRIVPCGLNFFNRHRFRSRFYADFGVPITVPDNLVAMYREGGDAKKKACTDLLHIIHTAVENLTLNAPSYDELRLYKATRRLYATGKNLNVSQKLELTRRFAKGYSKLFLCSSHLHPTCRVPPASPLPVVRTRNPALWTRGTVGHQGSQAKRTRSHVVVPVVSPGLTMAWTRLDRHMEDHCVSGLDARMLHCGCHSVDLLGPSLGGTGGLLDGGSIDRILVRCDTRSVPSHGVLHCLDLGVANRP